MSVDPDRACDHENIHIHLHQVLLEDSGNRQLEARLWCTDCDEPFLWPESVPIGVDLHGVARSFDGLELRIAIRSAADFPRDLLDGDDR